MKLSRFFRFTFKIIFLIVYFLTENVITTNAKKETRFAVNENILQQLRTLKSEDQKINMEGSFIKNAGKRAVLENKELLNEYFSTKATNVKENIEEKLKYKRQVSILYVLRF